MKKFFIISLVFSLATPFLARAEAFNPNLLIEDARFADTETLGGAEGIQKFLEIRGSVLANTSPEFLLKLREPDASLKERLPDPRPDLSRLRTAAELIYDSASSAGINPQVVLVTLQKEQSLITGSTFSDSGLQRALDRALGFGCPDGGSCGDIFLGFYHQLFGNFDSEGNRYIGMPASLARSFNFEVGGVRVGRGPAVDGSGNALSSSAKTRTSRVGDTIVLENTQGPPNNAAATQVVSLSNFATAALYRYTPHVYNGNYNFWKFFNLWFRYANGTLLRPTTESKIYIIDNGLRRPISSFVLTQRGLDPAAILTVSPTEISDFPVGPVTPPTNGTIIRDSSRAYLIIDGQRKVLSTFVASQRGLSIANAVVLDDAEVASYEDGGVALPEEGTLVKSSDSAGVYLITNNEKRLLTGFVFKQRGYSFADVLVAEPGELDAYPTGSLLPPTDGTLLKASSEAQIYYVSNGFLQPVSYFVFVERDLSFRDVVNVSKDEQSSWPTGKPLPPDTGVLVKAKSDPAVYYFEAGVRRPVSYGIFIARGFDFKDVLSAEDAELIGFEIGDPLELPDRALVKTEDGSAVYYLVDGVLRPLTLKAFQNRSFKFENVVTIPVEEFNKYPVGALVEN